MKLTNLIWVLALAGSVAACNSGSPITNERPPVVTPPGSGGSNGDGGTGGTTVEGCGLTAGSGACVTEGNIAVYENLVYTNGDGEFSRAIDAQGPLAVTASSEVRLRYLQSAAVVPRPEIVLGCFPSCPADVIEALRNASQCARTPRSRRLRERPAYR